MGMPNTGLFRGHGIDRPIQTPPPPPPPRNELYDPNFIPAWRRPENQIQEAIIPEQTLGGTPIDKPPEDITYGDYIDYIRSVNNPLGYMEWRENPLSPVERIPEVNPNLFSWGAEGLIPLGGATTNRVDPFLSILEEYASGQPIEAGNWQEAVANSLQGFMRSLPIIENRVADDPATIWNPEVAGLPGSQFRLGELQNLVQDPSIAGLFFNTQGDFSQGLWREVTNGHGVTLGWEQLDTQGNVIAQEIDPDAYSMGQRNAQIMLRAAGISPLAPMAPANRRSSANQNEIDPLLGLRPQDKLLVFEDIPVGSPLEQILGPIPGWESDEDFNDFIFRLDIGQYEPAPELIEVSPEKQLAEFFDTPGYQLQFGNPNTNPEAFDPYLSPEDRFRADPGYQFMQDEGLRQLARQHAARGLLESGPGLRGMTEYSTNLANQEYQKWQARQMQAWQNYVGGLSGIAQQGSQFSNPNLGLQLAGLTQGAGGDLASILGNQGIFGANAVLNTGAAQANTSLQAASIQAQLKAAEAMANAQIQAANAASGGGGGGFGQALGAIGGLAGK